MQGHGHDLAGRIKQVAQSRLTSYGPPGLELAAIAQHAGITLAQLRTYYDDREDLFTAMILDAYNAMGAEAEAGDREAVIRHAGPLERWQATCRSIRLWAEAHPHEYALIWGPPLPGYSAPPESMIAGSRATLALIGILRQSTGHNSAGHNGALVNLDTNLSAGMRQIVTTLSEGMFAGLSDPVIARVLIAWTQLMGAVSFAVYGHVHEFVGDPEAFFEHTSAVMGRFVGLTG
jgi:AcrR family transcriptional regulator